MHSATKCLLACGLVVASAVALPSQLSAQTFNLAEQLDAGKLRTNTRKATKIPERNGIQLAAGEGNAVIWIDGSDFGEGTIELEVRGRDVFQSSFLGVAFHGQDDKTYECVYLRPFNFRATDPARHQHAVQYIALPDFDWPRLRKEFPEEFENPVDASVAPTDWVPLKIVVKGTTVQIFVGKVTTPTLEVRKLGQLNRGMIGLWTGNTSDGDFANVRVTPMK